MEKQIKDVLIEKTAEALGHSEKVCSEVIKWSYLKAREATQIAGQVEIAGFGTFNLHIKTISGKLDDREIMLERLNNNLNNNLPAGSLKNTERAIEYTENYINWLKDKKRKLDEQNSRISEASTISNEESTKGD